MCLTNLADSSKAGQVPGNLAVNAVEIEEATSTLAEQPFDPSEFPYAFLRAFNKETTIKRLSAAGTMRAWTHPPEPSTIDCQVGADLTSL